MRRMLPQFPKLPRTLNFAKAKFSFTSFLNLSKIDKYDHNYQLTNARTRYLDKPEN